MKKEMKSSMNAIFYWIHYINNYLYNKSVFKGRAIRR